MTTVRLSLPNEVLDELDLPYEGLRGGPDDLSIGIEGINVAASLVTLATLRPQLSALARAVRRWRRRDGRDTVVLTVRGHGLDLRLDLPANVQTADILAALQRLLNGPPAGA
jgi:hypothetical protein